MKKISEIFMFFTVLGLMPIFVQAETEPLRNGSYFDKMVSQIKKPTQVNEEAEVQSAVPTSNFFGYAEKIKKKNEMKEKEVVLRYPTTQSAGSFVDPQSFFANPDATISSESE